jgi:hypothetical protein
MPQQPHIRDSEGVVREGASLRPDEIALTELSGVDLSFIRIDHQTRLQFEDVEVVIESPFTLTSRDLTVTLDAREDLGPLLALYPDTLASLSVGSDCTLRITFVSGASLEVPADPQYEAWQVAGPAGALVVCQPGGEGLACWT